MFIRVSWRMRREPFRPCSDGCATAGGRRQKKIQTTKSEKKGDEGKKKVKYRRPCILLLLQPSENGSRIPTMSSRKRRNPRSPSLRPEAAVRANIWKGQFLVSDSNESALFLFLWLPLLWPFFFLQEGIYHVRKSNRSTPPLPRRPFLSKNIHRCYAVTHNRC